MLAEKLQEAAGNGIASTLYVDDVFSTWLYTGNGSTQTITNGIDLAGKGGLVWVKKRTNNIGGTVGTNHYLVDSSRGANNCLMTDNNSGQQLYTNSIYNFTSSSFTVGNYSPLGVNALNNSSENYASWAFCKAAKFFDVVTWTGDGTLNRQIPHSLGVVPGMIIIKRFDAADSWWTYHRGNTSPNANWWENYLVLNTTAATAGSITEFGQPTSSTITLAPASLYYNTSGQQFVAYLFAHDTASDGIIQCGSFTTDSSGNATVSLGWEPQYLLTKRSDSTGAWWMMDTMRGMPIGGSNQQLWANTNDAEFSGGQDAKPSATGFYVTGTNASATFIYMAIRRPNKPPTSGTQVYNAIARTGTGATAAVTGLGFTPDFVFPMGRSATGGYASVFDRLRGVNIFMDTSNTGSETTASQSLMSFDMDGFTLGSSTTYLNTNVSARTYINWNFKRAPGFFDVVCTQSGQYSVPHNLGVPPEIIISKQRNSGGSPEWFVTVPSLGYAYLNTTAAFFGAPVYGAFTATNFTTPVIGTYNAVNYLFATLAGISKVGSYTGNGTTQNIDCGFAAGARFFLVKATSTTGSWWVWDSARGIVAGNDPALQLNSTAAEITTADAVDPYSPGITVNQEATCSINASGVSYIFLAVA